MAFATPSISALGEPSRRRNTRGTYQFSPATPLQRLLAIVGLRSGNRLAQGGRMFRLTSLVGTLIVLVFMALQGAQAQAVIDNVDDLYAAALAGGSYTLVAGVYELQETLVIDAPFELVG